VDKGENNVKKIFSLLVVAAFAMLCATTVFAQSQGGELKISGEAKTGIDWEESQNLGEEKVRKVKIRSRDDAGDAQGRFRLNMDYEREDGFGMRTRFQFQDSWRNDPGFFLNYGFGYGNWFDRQLTVSVGKLGGSPWGTGGPEMWKELEESTIGMRVEYKPSFAPGLNVGFVLSDFNGAGDGGAADDPEKVTIMEILKETVVGISYTHDFFLARVGFRFDSDLDATSDRTGGDDDGIGEDEFVYRVEERILTQFVPGLQIWAIGHLFGLSAERDDVRLYRNWFFIQYDPPSLGNLETPFTAQVRLGYNAIKSRGELFVKPSFYWHFFNKLISVGAAYTYAIDTGEDKIQGDHPYYYMEIEPKIQFNFQNSYVAFVYNWKRQYYHADLAPSKPDGTLYEAFNQTQFMNLRFCIYF